MCNFLSVVSDGLGLCYYMDWDERKKIIKGKSDYIADSHSSIAEKYGFKNGDKLNKWEYNPLTQKLVSDQMNTKNDTRKVLSLCKSLDFAEIIPQIILKPIIHPFKIKNRKGVTKKDIDLLRNWESACDSIRNSIGESIGDSVYESIGKSVYESVWDSIGESVYDSIYESIRNSVGDSIWDSVWDSIGESIWDSIGKSVYESAWDSIGGYIGSFFIIDKWKYVDHKKGEYPFQSVVDLWDRGLVPSFDGTVWRLHAAKGVIYEISAKELKEKS